MKLKNLTSRTVSVLGKHPSAGGMPFRVSIIASSTLELSNEDYARVTPAVSLLVSEGVLEVTEAPETKLTNAEIVEKVLAEAEVKLNPKATKAKLQEQAMLLGVEL